MDRHYYINVICMVYFFIVYLTYAISKWSTILKFYVSFSVIRVCCCSCVWNCYSSFNKYYASLELHKLDLSIEVLNLIGLPVLCTPYDPSFFSIQLLVLNLDGWFGVLSKTLTVFWYSNSILLYKCQISNNFLHFFWIYIYFFKNLFIILISNCF